MPKSQSLAEQNAVEVPLYTHLDAARYLRVPIWLTLAASSHLPHHPMAFFERCWRQEPLFRNRFADDYGPLLENEEAARVSFRSLASLFVVTAVFRPFFAPQPLWHSKEGVLFFEMTLEAMGRVRRRSVLPISDN